MKLINIKNRNEFFKKVEQCSGSVELHTNNGDVLNLKSLLCQYIALTQLLQEDQSIECELVLSNPEDLQIIREYLVLE